MTFDPIGEADVVSVYRRPLPSTKLRFLSAVMFDGRETIVSLTSAMTYSNNLQSDLTHQALDATLGHATATAEKLRGIVKFELGLSTAQMCNHDGGPLSLSLRSRRWAAGVVEASVLSRLQ